MQTQKLLCKSKIPRYPHNTGNHQCDPSATPPITIHNQALSATPRSWEKHKPLLALSYADQIMDKVYFLFDFSVSPMK